MLSLAGVWSAKVRRLTVLNRERFVAIHARLEDGYSYAALRAAIEKYGADEWHRRTGAWLDLADFMRPKNLDKWFVECAERERVAEQKQAQRTPLAPPVRGVVREVAKALKAPTPADEERARIAEFKAMPEAERAAVLDQAAREWAGLHPQRNPLPADLAYYPIARQVCEILKRRKAGEARPP
ncbi:hypothetical protein [Zavarzinia sp.]|uniref:hypothetical protein n=1 Tax=Zavarzinia sp. TaxID=2027920 RepID=UPI003564220D